MPARLDCREAVERYDAIIARAAHIIERLFAVCSSVHFNIDFLRFHFYLHSMCSAPIGSFIDRMCSVRTPIRRHATLHTRWKVVKHLHGFHLINQQSLIHCKLWLISFVCQLLLARLQRQSIQAARSNRAKVPIYTKFYRSLVRSVHDQFYHFFFNDSCVRFFFQSKQRL